jgi:hypothetical protein
MIYIGGDLFCVYDLHGVDIVIEGDIDNPQNYYVSYADEFEDEEYENVTIYRKW